MSRGQRDMTTRPSRDSLNDGRAALLGLRRHEGGGLVMDYEGAALPQGDRIVASGQTALPSFQAHQLEKKLEQY